MNRGKVLLEMALPLFTRLPGEPLPYEQIVATRLTYHPGVPGEAGVYGAPHYLLESRGAGEPYFGLLLPESWVRGLREVITDLTHALEAE